MKKLVGTKRKFSDAQAYEYTNKQKSQAKRTPKNDIFEMHLKDVVSY